jgi:hypothetical protein
MASTYQKRRKQGLCGNCGDLPTPGFVTCERCREDSKLNCQANAALMADNRLCRYCKASLPDDCTFQGCETCRDFLKEKRKKGKRRTERRASLRLKEAKKILDDLIPYLDHGDDLAPEYEVARDAAMRFAASN